MTQENTTKRDFDKKILICDDDETVCDFLQRFLNKEGYKQVDIVLSGKEALEKISQEHHQLVLLDIKMPGMDGLETLSRIKEIDKNIGVIMITAFPDTENAEAAMKMGAYDYIIKPFDLAYLKLVVLTKILID